MTGAVGAVIVLTLVSIPVLANDVGANPKRAAPIKVKKPAACSTKSVAYRGSKPVKRGSKAKPVKPPRVCRTPLPPSAKFLPSFVPSTVAAELGVRAKNGGQHGWAKLGATLGANSTFTGPTGKVGIRLLGAPTATRTDFENGAAYVAKSYTAVQVFQGTSFKESIVVPKRLGARNWSWKLTLPKGRVPSVTANGGVNLGVGLFIPAPVVTRADGTKITTGSAWSVRPDGILTLRLNDAKFPTPYIIDPGVVPEVAFTGFSAASGNTYVDPSYALSRIFYNASQSGSFTVNAAVHDPDTATPVDVCYPVFGSGWTADGGCVPGSAGVPQGGILATYYSGSTSGSTYPGSAFTTNNNGTNCANNSATPVGPFSRIEQGINSYSYWGAPGVNDDAPYAELCADSFSGRWRGAIRTGATGGMHLFGAISDDGVRVTINGTRVLSEWSEHTPTWHTSCPITLTANTTYPIEVEYFENNSTNRAQLRWWTLGSGSGPGGTANCLNPGDPIRTWIRTTAAGSTPWAPINESGVNAPNGTAPTNWPIIPSGTTTTPGLHMPSNTFARTYSWTPGAAVPTPATQDIVVRDEDPDPDPGTTPFTAIADGVGPTGGTISINTPLNGGVYTATTGVTLNFNANGTTDGTPGLVSGMKPQNGEIYRQRTTYSNGVCGAWPTSWVLGGNVTSAGSSVTPTANVSNDATRIGPLASGSCYRWAITFEDNVDNWGASTPTPALMIDTAAPPAASVTLTEATNPAWMHVSGSTIYYNGNTGNTGTFTVDVAATDPVSGVESVTFPGFATWPTGAASSADTVAPYSRTYGWDDASTQPGASLTTVVRDVAGHTTPSAAFSVLRDVTAPAAVTITYTNGMYGSASHTVGFNRGNDGTGSGIATWRVERRSTPMQAGGVCDPYVTAWALDSVVDPAGTSYLSSGLIAGNCYQWRTVSTDNVGNVTIAASANELKYDDVPPVASFVGIVGVTGNAWRQPLTNTIWYSNATAGGFRTQVTATDSLGVAGVNFPATGAAGWSGPVPTFDSTGVADVFESAPYSWAIGAADPATITSVATDAAGNAANVAWDINLDVTAPAGGSLSLPSPIQQSLTIPVTIVVPTDAGSGIATWIVEMQAGTLSNGSCSAYGGYTTVQSGTGTPPTSLNMVVAGSGCYLARLVATDNVGNVIAAGFSSPTPARVDATPPAVTVTGPADNSAQGGTFTINGTGTETHSSLANVSVTYTGASTGTACASATLTPGAPGAWTWACAWTTPLVDGNYTLTITATDTAGNTSTTTWNYLVDNVAPLASFTSWTETSAYLHAAGGADSDLLWYNPSAPAAGSGTATATVTATDAGAGMDRVDFPALGAAGWAGSGSDTTVAAGDLWSWDYTFTGGGAIGDPAPNNAVARDDAGATTGSPDLDFRIEPDSTPPTGSAHTAFSGLQNTTSFSSTLTVGTDSESGVARFGFDLNFAPLEDGVCGTWDGWSAAGGGYAQAANDGDVITFTHYVNDSNFDGIPNYNDSFCMQARVNVFDNVGNVVQVPPNGIIQVDLSDPTVAITTPVSGTSQSGTFNVVGTADDDYVGTAPEYPLTGSGIDYVTVTYGGPATGTICAAAPVTGPWTGHGWSCPWVTNALPDGLYTVTARSRDRSGRWSTVSTSTYTLDNQAPIINFHSWLEGLGGGQMHAVGNVAWINPSAPVGSYELDARVTATDAGSGVASVSFPAFGAGWSPSTAGNATLTSPLPVADAYTRGFTFVSGGSLATPGSLVATATDGAGNTATTPFEVRFDGDAPTGASASVVAGLQNTTTISVTLASGVEGALESGLGAWLVQYDTAPLADDTCGAFTNSWNVAANGVGIAPASIAHNVTAFGSQCYRYRLRVTDNVGNSMTSAASTDARRVDVIAPTVATLSPVSGSANSGTFAVSGTATDAHSGIDHVRLTYLGGGGGTICDPATLGGASPNWTFSCSWNTTALPDGPYTVRAISYDRAGNPSAPVDIVVNLDNQPPFIGFHSFTESSNYTHWAGPVGTNNRIWFNPTAPAGSHSFDVNVTATDLGSGVDRVEFDGAGIGWTPGGAVASDPTAAATPVADSYTATYTFDSANPGLVDPPTLQATAFDPAGNPGTSPFEITADTDAPTAGSVGYSNGFVASTTVSVSIDTGDDGVGSGIKSWELVRSDGTLSGSSCVGWGAFSTSVATGTGSFVGSQADTVSDPGCFRYELRVRDNVHNLATSTSPNEIMVDLTPPTGTITLAPATSPASQYLATPTRLYVNTGAGHSGTFTATVNANAASGVLDVNFPALAAGFSGDGTMPGPGPTFVRTYSWVAGAGSPPAGTDAVVQSNSLGFVDLPFDVVADPTAPSGGTTTYTSGFTSATTASISYTIGADAGAGIAGHQLQREAGVLAAGACTWSGTWTNAGAANGPLTYNDPALAHATCYRYRVEVTDRVGNIGTTTPGLPIMVDTTAPTGATLDFVEDGTDFASTHVPSATTIYYRNGVGTVGSPQNFFMDVRAVDPESGTGVVAFPVLAGNWAAGAATPIAGGSRVSYGRWTTALEPGVVTAIVPNGAGMTTTVTGTILEDTGVSSAANWSIDYTHGFNITTSIAVNWVADLTDDRSGFATATLQRRAYPFNLGTTLCDQTSFVDSSLGALVGTTYTDNSLVRPTCYRYSITITDNVGNSATINPTTGGAVPQLFDTAWATWNWKTTAAVDDIYPPAAFNLTLPTNPVLPIITTAAAAPSCETAPTFGSATPAFGWSASSDAESGLDRYDVYVDGIGTVDGTVAAPGTSWTAPALTDGAHTLGVRAIDMQSNSTDAGPAFPTTVRIDAAAPTAALTAPANGGWTSDTTPTLTWAAADANCLARVEVYVDDLVTPVAIASGSETTWTPGGALAEGLHSWRVEAVDAFGRRTSSPTFSFGVDTVAPAAFTLTAPTAGTTVRGFIDVTWTASSDGGSGLSGVSAYQVLIDGIVRTTVGSAVMTANITGITNGIHTVEVRAVDQVGNVTMTTSETFTGFGVIAAPTLISPANNARINTVPLLDWNWPSDGGPAPTDYDVLVNGIVVTNVTHPTSDFAMLDPGDGVHTWQVVQHDPYTGTVSSVIRTFTLDRTAPTNTGPLTRLVTTVSWPAVSDPVVPVATGIDRQEFWIDNGGGPVLAATLAAGATSYDYGVLPDGIYTMFVRAYDNAGNSTDTPPIVITNDSVPPTAFTLTPPGALPALPAITVGPNTPPSCETVPTYLSATPTLSWSASSDATSGLAGYDVYIDGALVATVPAGTTSYVVATPLSAGAHDWHVVARDNFGSSRSSTPAPMNVRVDLTAPTAALASPANGAFLGDTTPDLTWTAGDDNCAARIELTVDGAVIGTFAPTAASWTPAAALAEGAHTWSIRVFDSAGNITSSGAARTFTIDTTAPAAITAVTPPDTGSINEGMLTFDWTDGTDGGSGITRYDITIDGAPVQSNLATSTHGTVAVYAGVHSWTIRAYDAVGNFADFPFTFTALAVPDTTAPSGFNLLTPTSGAAITSGTALTWSPSWDFYGIASYRIYIDGQLSGTVAGNVTTFTPTVGVGSAICTADYDPSPNAACITGQSFSNGELAGGASTPAAVASSDWNAATQPGWSAAGAAFGVGDATVMPTTAAGAGFDGDRMWTAMEYTTSVPASGADLRFEHRYRFHKVGDVVLDGGTVELQIDDAGDGFGNDPWETTCTYGADATYQTTVDCDHEVVEVDGGYDAVFSGPVANHPLAYQNGFSGSPTGTQQTKIRLSEFAGKDIRFRFRIGMDSCYSNQPAWRDAYCQPGFGAAVWRIDDVTLANPSLLPGPHTWNVQALDPTGNATTSNQTWSFNLS